MPKLNFKIKIALLVGVTAFIASGPLQRFGLVPQTALGNASKAVFKSMNRALFPPAFATCENGLGSIGNALSGTPGTPAPGTGSNGSQAPTSTFTPPGVAAADGTGAATTTGRGAGSDVLASSGTGATGGSAAASALSVGMPGGSGGFGGGGRGSGGDRAHSVPLADGSSGASGTNVAASALGADSSSGIAGTGAGQRPVLVSSLSDAFGGQRTNGASGNASAAGSAIGPGTSGASIATSGGESGSGSSAGAAGASGDGAASPKTFLAPLLLGGFPLLQDIRPRILLVDANDDERAHTRRLLQFDGYAVLEAANAREGMDLFEHYKPRIILVDPALAPANDGLAFARKLRNTEHGAEVALVATTSRAHDEEERQTRAAGFDAYLAKPLNLQQLRRAIFLAERQQSAPSARTAGNQVTDRPTAMALNGTGRSFYAPAMTQSR